MHLEAAEAAVVIVRVVVHRRWHAAGNDAPCATIVGAGRFDGVLVVVAIRL